MEGKKARTLALLYVFRTEPSRGSVCLFGGFDREVVGYLTLFGARTRTGV